jgi:hypothetical protein
LKERKPQLNREAVDKFIQKNMSLIASGSKQKVRKQDKENFRTSSPSFVEASK